MNKINLDWERTQKRKRKLKEMMGPKRRRRTRKRRRTKKMQILIQIKNTKSTSDRLERIELKHCKWMKIIHLMRR